ncbi:MAG: alginate export family protein [Nitrospiraceae bacterium]
MTSIHGRVQKACLTVLVGAALTLVLPLFSMPALAGFELPPGERITNLPAIPRNMPQKEAYELYDPVIGRNFDIKNLWLRADLRVRPEMRTNTCFGQAINANGSCNTFGTRGVPGGVGSNGGNKGNDFFVQQWVRLGIGYDLSPDVNFYMEIIDSATWGGNGIAVNAGNGGDPLNHNCGSSPVGPQGSAISSNCRLGVRAAYVLIRNLAGIEGFSMKAGRQYVVFGNHSLFGHFDWANTVYSHDGVMFAYQTKNFDSYLGWFRNSESDLAQAAPVGSGGPNIAGGTATPGGAINAVGNDANRDADMIIFYNQIKSVPGMVIEPYYVYYKNNFSSADNAAFLGAAKHSNQTRHMIGNRIEMRMGGFDFSNEIAWQFGQMGQAGACTGEQKCLHINAWATRNWIGYTAYEWKWKPRVAFNFDYASGDGRNNTCGPTPGSCSTANTFENFFPTNHIHMGYMDVQAWKNMLSPSINFQARPSVRDHIELWYSNLNLASSKDCWYRASQGCYVFSNANNTNRHVGDEIDLSWTRMFADGKVAVQATYGTLFTGGYLTSTLNQQVNQHWAYISLWMNF